MPPFPLPTSDSSPDHRHRHAITAVGVVLATVALVAFGGPAGAQTTTSLPTPPTTLPAENPGSTAAGVVFFGVCAVVIVGALVLYLRNRRPRGTGPET